MSAGVYRKQYKALVSLAEGLGVEIQTPGGSFNQKFCEACRLLIEGLGGTFTPVTGGSFTTRKGVYLRQVAVAIGLSITPGATTFRELFLKSARTIWEAANDGISPDFGASLDWRVYQYLVHTITGPADPDQIIQWLNAYKDGDYVDLIDPLQVSLPQVTNVSVLNFAAGGTITAAQILATDTLTHNGTAALTANNGSITVGAGYVSQISVNGELTYICEEGDGTELPDNTGNGNNATFTGGAWSTAAGIPSANLEHGHTPSVSSDGSGQHANTGIHVGEDYRIKCKFIPNEALTTPFGVFNGSPQRLAIEFQSTSVNCGFLGDTVITPFPTSFGRLYDIDLSKDGLCIDGINITGPLTTLVPEISADLYLMARNREDLGGIDLSGDCSLFDIEILSDYTDDSSTIFDAIPITNPTLGAGFYDKVNKEFYYNDGSGTLKFETPPALLEGQNTSAVATFDGVGAYMTSDSVFSPGTADFDIDGGIIYDATSADTGFIFDARDAFQDGFLVEAVSDRLIKCTFNSIPSGSLELADGFNTFSVKRRGDNLTLAVNDISSTVDVAGQSINVTNLARVGARNFSTPSSHLKFSLKNLSVTGLPDIDLSGVVGKTTTSVNGWTIATGAGGLDSFWAKRFVDASGIPVDAKYYLPLGDAGQVHYPDIGILSNGCEVSLTQTDAALNFSSVFYDGVTPKDLYWSDQIQITPYLDNQVIRWMPDTIGTNGRCLLIDWLQYPELYQFTAGSYLRTENWRKQYGGSCGAAPLEAVTDSGEIVTDNGFVVFDGGA